MFIAGESDLVADPFTVVGGDPFATAPLSGGGGALLAWGGLGGDPIRSGVADPIGEPFEDPFSSLSSLTGVPLGEAPFESNAEGDGEPPAVLATSAVDLIDGSGLFTDLEAEAEAREAQLAVSLGGLTGEQPQDDAQARL